MTNVTTPSPFQPAEWETHEACWLAWPSHGNLWEENLAPAQQEFTALARAITGIDYTSSLPEERLEILVPDDKSLETAKAALQGLPVRFHKIPFGDIWLRDTAPLFLKNGDQVSAASFQFNGWGGKYVLPHDSQVSLCVAKASGVPFQIYDWVLEGGSIEVDGEGTCLTSKQCLLNPNRNPGMNQEQIETALKKALGVSKVLWVTEGLINDHTDGHIDTIARYVAPGVVACMAPLDKNDPNASILEKIHAELSAMTDAKGRKLKVVTIPSPGAVLNEEGDLMPASHLNFYIGNRTVVIPTYGTNQDSAVEKAVAAIFPGRKALALSAKAILSGGGAFHCITQQQPAKLK